MPTRQPLQLSGQIIEMNQRTCGKRLMFAQLSETERHKILSYGHVINRHSKKASQYHGARFSQSKHSLRQFLLDYKPGNEHDEALSEPVNWMNQAEYFIEAKARLSDLSTLPSLAHVIDFVPIVCRTLTMRLPLPAGLHMCPWLGKVESMPTILTRTTTVDFFQRFKNKSFSHGENINSIMLLSSDPGGSLLSKGFGKHLASYLLTRNSDIYMAEADLATWMMVAMYILNREKIQGWMLDELETLRSMHRAVYAGECSWTKYTAVVASSEFAQALGSQCASHFLSTPHIGKFILAAFFSDGLGKEQLQARRDAAIVEHVSRLKLPSVSDVFTANFQVTPKSILEDIDFEFHATVHECRRAFNAQLQNACFFALAKRDILHLICRRSVLGSDSVRLDDLKHRKFDRWNLSPLVIERVFGSMGRLRGFELDPVDDWPSMIVSGIEGRPTTFKSVFPVVEGELVAKFVAHVRSVAHGYVHAKFNHVSCLMHVGLPVVISRDFAGAFEKKHGRDLLEELDVNEYGMSRCACMFPTCSFFAKPIGKKFTKGPPRMTDKLQQHLAIFGHVRGVHRAVLTRPDEPTQAIVDGIVRSTVGLTPWVTVGVANQIREGLPFETLERMFLG